MRSPRVCTIGPHRIAYVRTGAGTPVLRRALYHEDRLTKELLDHVKEPLRTVAGRKAFLHFARCLDNRDLLSITDDLGRLTVPTQILRGEADVYPPRTISERLHAAIPDSRLFQCETAGHYRQEDEPAWLARRLLAFFRTHAEPPASGAGDERSQALRPRNETQRNDKQHA